VGPEYGDVLVGEEGPELVRFAQAGTVVPAAQTAQLMAAGGNPAPSSRTYSATVVNQGDKVTEQTVVRALRRAEMNDWAGVSA
jgi:phage-related minor tail protein